MSEKITIDNLESASAQDVFNQAARHLLTQNERSLMPNGLACRYRGENGKQCAAGPFIPDEKYKPEMEGNGWISLITQFKFPSLHGALISRLQTTHDSYGPDEWKTELSRVAEKYNLSSDVLSEF